MSTARGTTRSQQDDELSLSQLARWLEAISAPIQRAGYADTIHSNGFDTWHALADITMEDFTAMGVRRGHVRQILAQIAKEGAIGGDGNSSACASSELTKMTPTDSGGSSEAETETETETGIETGTETWTETEAETETETETEAEAEVEAETVALPTIISEA